MTKEEFLKKWKPQINSVKYSTWDFESDLDEYTRQESREKLIKFCFHHQGFLFDALQKEGKSLREFVDKWLNQQK